MRKINSNDRDMLGRAFEQVKLYVKAVEGFVPLLRLGELDKAGYSEHDQKLIGPFLHRTASAFADIEVVKLFTLRTSLRASATLYLSNDARFVVIKRPRMDRTDDKEEYFRVFESTDEMLDFLLKKEPRQTYESQQFPRTGEYISVQDIADQLNDLVVNALRSLPV